MSRNVEALFSVLRRTLAPSIPDVTVNDLAIQLAASRVLAVDSLTDEECEIAWGGAAEYPGTSWDGADFEHPDAMRAALRRCATGEGA